MSAPDSVGSAAVEISGAVGRNVRAERERQGLSIRALARRLDVTASFLSQFELGQSQSSVKTLWAIARELDVSMDYLLEGRDDSPDGEARLPTADEYLQLSSGVTWQRLAHSSKQGVDLVLTDYAPGADSAPEGSPQSHRGMDYGYVVSGTLTVIVGDLTYEVSEGAAVIIDGTQPHRLINYSDTPARAVWAVVEGPPSSARRSRKA